MEAAHGEVMPLLDEKRDRQRSVFVPGHRIRMNVVPMFLNVFVPWGVFVFCSGISSFWLMYAHPGVAWSLLSIVFIIWAWMSVMALWARRFEPDPTWFTYAAAVIFLMALSGTMAGLQNFNHFSRAYFEIKTLKVLDDIDANAIPGKNVLDAGIVGFRKGNHLDGNRAWHFKWKTTYCIAPIITNGTAPPNKAYDFWAVGKDCCSISSSDFRCGAWSYNGAPGGIRVISQGDMKYYNLAVQQAESLYNITASNPIFLEWSSHPALEVESWNQQVFKNYLFMVVLALIICVFLMTFALCGYSFIGRTRSVYGTDILDDPTWQQGVMGKPHDYIVRSYGSYQMNAESIGWCPRP